MASAHTLPLALSKCLSAGFFAVDDPGASGTISIERGKGTRVICQVVTAAAESRVLPTASSLPVGQEILVILQTDGGNLTITGAAESVVLDSGGDYALFVVVDNAGTRAWRVIRDTTDVEQATVILDAQSEDIAAGTGGAISVATYYTTLDSDAGGDAFTLADGTYVGQLKKIQMIVDGGGSAVITLTTPEDENTITMANAGDFVVLRWSGTGWRVVEAGNAADGVTAPALSTV